ncbi:MAG: hypothetical protein FWC36_00075 [Spirochaetes bacterium]|nr:hypothetical protein [Spirochaetota bacterium]
MVSDSSHCFVSVFMLCLRGMTITQTVEIPENRRLTIDVPREIPTGKTILTFTPVAAGSMSATEKALERPEAQDMEIINRNAERLNREALDVLSFQTLDL